MKNLVIYDPEPYMHDYISHKFFVPLLKYGAERNISIRKTDSLNGIKNHGVLSFAGYLTPEAILRLKENGNQIFSFDITDSTWLCDKYMYDHKACSAIDLIFKYSGIPKVNESSELRISDSIEYTKEPKKYLQTDEDWDFFCGLRDSGKIIPMPHIPWQPCSLRRVKFDSKLKKCLVRGSNHYLRYHLYMVLLLHGMITKWSGFILKEYHERSMVDEFRFCDDCVEAYEKYGRVPYEHYKNSKHRCNNAYIDMDNVKEGDFQNHNNHRWNNKCVPMYYWLTERFMERHGNLDMAMVENALNGFRLDFEDLNTVIAHHLYYTDYKWIYSIDIPPRFWEGAAAGTINLLPDWTDNNTHFPDLRPWTHYVPFDAAFDNIESVLDIEGERYEQMSHECMKLYQTWIVGKEFGASENLMNRILNSIEECGS